MRYCRQLADFPVAVELGWENVNGRQSVDLPPDIPTVTRSVAALLAASGLTDRRQPRVTGNTNRLFEVSVSL